MRSTLGEWMSRLRGRHSHESDCDLQYNKDETKNICKNVSTCDIYLIVCQQELTRNLSHGNNL